MAATDGTTTRIGLIGLGSLGSQVWAALHSRGGGPAACHDADPVGVAERMRERFGAEVPMVATAADVAEACDVVAVVVFDEAQVDDVCFGPTGLASSTRRPLHVLLMSTVSIPYVERAGAALAEHGIVLVDCGMNGGGGVAEGKAVVSVGATPEAFAAVRPALEAISDAVVHVGPLGDGMKAKLIRNMVTYATWYAGWLGAATADAVGLDLDKVLEVIDRAEPLANGATFFAHQARRRGPADPASAGSGPSMLTATAQKDLAAVQALAATGGLALPVVALISEAYPEVEHL